MNCWKIPEEHRADSVGGFSEGGDCLLKRLGGDGFFCRRPVQPVLLLGGGKLDISGEPECRQRTYCPVSDVELPPFQAVGGGPEEGVVVIVPTLAVGQESHPPVVGGLIFRGPCPVTPCVGRRIDKPGAVPHEDGSQEDAPEHHGPASPEVKDYAQNRLIDAVRVVQEPVNPVICQVGGVVPVLFKDIEPLIEGEKPSHVGPPEAFGRAVGIGRFIRIGVVKAVDCHPFDRAVLVRETAEQGEKILQGLPQAERPVRQEAMVA